jgi:hypothetical protein
MKIALGLLFCLTAWWSSAQKIVANFTLTNVSDDGSVSLDSFSSASGVAIIFTSNVCPYDGYYQARIRNLISTYQGKIQVLLINSHLEPDESEANMKTAFGQWNLAAPYLADKDQTVMHELGAKKSPEAFLLKRKNGKFEVFYSGAIDDNPQMAKAVIKTISRHPLTVCCQVRPLNFHQPERSGVRYGISDVSDTTRVSDTLDAEITAIRNLHQQHLHLLCLGMLTYLFKRHDEVPESATHNVQAGTRFKK